METNVSLEKVDIDDQQNKLTDLIFSITSHGIHNIVRSKNLIIKMTWLIFLCFLTAGCFTSIFKSVKNYLAHEVVTQTTIRDQFPPEFPTITICNRNSFATLEAKMLYENTMDEFKNMTYKDRIRYLFFYAHKYSDTVKQSLGLKLKEFIYECTFNGYKCDYDNDFVWHYDYHLGNCFVFNSGKNFTGHKKKAKVVHKIGKYNGLQIKVFTGSSVIQSENMGIHINIHNSSVIPFNYEGFEIPSGLETNIEVNRVFIYKQEYPYSDCMSNIDGFGSYLSKATLASGNQYRQVDCLYNCLQELIIKRLGCFIPSKNVLNGTVPCLVSVLDKSYQIYMEYLSSYMNNHCMPSCPLECDSFRYQPLISHANFIIPENSNLSECNIEIMKSNLTLNIFYSSFSYTTIKEVIQTQFIDLVASIGGNLGLFMGASFLSFAEMIEFIFLFMSTLIDKKLRKNP